MSDHGGAVLGATESASADIAWAIVSVLCWILMAAPFVLWYAGVRTPRAERRAARSGNPATSAVDAASDAPAEEMTA